MSTATRQHRCPLGLFPDRLTRRLYDRIIQVLRVHHYSRRTEAAYIHWIRRYIEFHRHRHHLHESSVSKAIRAAVRRSDIRKRVTAHSFRHSFATHLIEEGYDIRTVQELVGQNDVWTTMVYTHVLNKAGRSVRSPGDFEDFVSRKRVRVIRNGSG